MWPKLSEIMAESESPKLESESNAESESPTEIRKSGRNFFI